MDLQHTSLKIGRVLAALCVLALVAAPLAACGKKGDPEPPDKTSQFPRTYPKR
ncbi:MAG: hypothetical protein O7C63_09735 [Alphaproteobacteria bacterium]|nr:hypothetical protein [Alphaproteobacteria bacterium]